MNSLLKRQIRKYLSQEQLDNNQLTDFLDAVNRSYNNFDEQYAMQQRAITMSSEELYDANNQLRKRAKSQQEVIEKLKRVVAILGGDDNVLEDNLTSKDWDGLKFVEVIDNQTKEIIEVNKQREHLLNELEYQNQELSDYAHMVSHDLKSPLRSIDTLVFWLKEDYKDALGTEGNKTLNSVRDNVERMEKLISGILEYSSISKSKKDTYNVDLNRLIDDIIGTIFVPKHIVISKLYNLPIVKGDKYKLQQLFQNLIENAIKYNDKEKGLIDISYKSVNGFWEFAIKDNGKGIEEKYHDKIFKTFEKLESNADSSGIGLSIVKKIVNLYGGKVWLDSKVNVGTTFYFTLKQ